MEEMTQSIKEWKVEKLSLCIDGDIFVGGNEEPGIVGQIQHISFPNLKSINLTANDLESVEALGRVHLPALFKIDISKECTM